MSERSRTFLVAVRDAKQDRRQLALGRVALERDRRPLPRSRSSRRRIGAFGHALGLGDVAQVGELQPAERAPRESRAGRCGRRSPTAFSADGDAQLRGQRADQRARQLGIGGGAPIGLLWAAPAGLSSASAPRRSSVRDVERCSSRAGISASMPSNASGREGELLQPVVQREIEVGEGLKIVPQHRPEPGAVVAREPRAPDRWLRARNPWRSSEGDAGEEGVSKYSIRSSTSVGVKIAPGGAGAALRRSSARRLRMAPPSGRSNAAF